MGRYFFIAAVAFLLASASCRHIDVKEKAVNLPHHEWPRNYKAVVEFDVADSTLYNLYFVVRHTERFAFTHLPVQIAIEDTARNAKPFITLRINAPLVHVDGSWSGSNMDDLYFHRIRIDVPVLLKRQPYRFILQQELPVDPLKEVLNAGIGITPIANSR